MQRTDIDATAKVTRRQVKPSTTLNRRYVKRPSKYTDITAPVKNPTKKNQMITHFRNEVPDSYIGPKKPDMNIAPAISHPVQTVANQRMKARLVNTEIPAANHNALVSPKTAKQLKDEAIKKALASTLRKDTNNKNISVAPEDSNKIHFGFGRVLLALSCAAVAVFAIVYFVNLNMPDISLRVAAMQTGIEASYPSYAPRNFSLSDINSQNGKITLVFRNSQADSSFTLEQEKSSWDTSALLSNYVKPTFSANYTTIREQGLTIYIDGGNAAWVNGGIMYKLFSDENVLTKKQIKSIATSL